jgi:hypothetical protein
VRIPRQACIALSAMVVAVGFAPANAGAAIGVGQTFVPSGGAAACGNDRTWIEYPVPTGGVITSWSFQADANPPQLEFKVARPTGTSNQYTVVGESPMEEPVANQLNTFPIRIAALAGDLIGFYTGTMNDCLRGISTGPSTFSLMGEAALESPATFTPTTEQIDVSATLEPDPDTTITGHPKAKTRKRKARFTFSSSVPGSSFECSLDGAAFTACGSPDAFKVSRGRHTFAVRARGPLGNVDPTPASDAWKFRKRR